MKTILMGLAEIVVVGGTGTAVVIGAIMASLYL